MNKFEDALHLHLQSIENRDIEAFAEFLHPSLNSIIILPNGGMVEGFDNIVNFHREWFADFDWKMDVEVIDTFIAGSVGYALLDVVYHDLDENGQPYELKYFLSLLFNEIDGKWILLRDQNTLK